MGSGPRSLNQSGDVKSGDASTKWTLRGLLFRPCSFMMSHSPS